MPREQRLASAVLRPALLLALTLMLSGCVRLTLAWAPQTPKGQEATPAIVASDRSEWEARKPAIEAALQEEIYGTLPVATEAKIAGHRVFEDQKLGEGLVFEEFDVAARPSFPGGSGEQASFTIALVRPASAKGSLPVIMVESFCPRWSAVPHPEAARPTGAEQGEVPGMIRFAFGRYICQPPLEMIAEAGFALALVSATEVVPDQSEAGIAALQRLMPEGEDARWGAVGAWAWVFSVMADILGEQDSIDADRLIAYGHSRYGKAALVAGAFDDSIAGVIAHQSGTGGASLNRRKSGESIEQITRSYPHWFTPAYAEFAGEEDRLQTDQHQLLALIAPRPVLLGNARRDVWSDPNGAFKAAIGAAPVYELYGEAVRPLERLGTFRPEEPVAYWMRPGTHGVVEEDWPAFLAFASAHFGD
ncbi:glucuronyl esterase domain-containing protein [Parvularcula maris]|uniref:4-O-methyl-glucuronoyl methylesterase-like domain-containing protein n=1 Tax=Parvularcula maris TaxID=2965077 RepID=A0A9X2L7P8_9PROT|nr:hypothetical protein [Parvularcula maris]MCQ8184466.1 hypothetical protein [Parvularcula maris]